MRVSVIIPVYNAGPYVREAVESALAQPEADEIVLVEDGSPDDSLAVCRELAHEYSKVKLYQHPNGENRGAGETRERAVLESKGEILAFLDADDYWLPGHLKLALETLEADPTLDGTYGMAEAFYEDESSRERFKTVFGYVRAERGVRQYVPPEELFKNVFTEQSGGFSVITLVVKKALVLQTMPFSRAVLHQDSILLTRVAAKGRLVSMTLDIPTAMIRYHPQNRFSVPRTITETWRLRRRYWEDHLTWSRIHLPPEKHYWIVHYVVRHMIGTPRYDWHYPAVLEPVLRRLRAILLPTVMPYLLVDGAYWRSLIYFLIPGKLRPRL